MKKVSCLSILGLVAASLLPLQAQALEVAYKPWFSRIQGDVSSSGRQVSLRNELNLEQATSQGFAVAEGRWLRLTYTPMDYAAEGVVNTTTQFGNSEYSQNTRLFTDANLTDMGARLMWFPFNDHEQDLGLGLGLTVKIVDADVELTNLDAKEEQGGGAGLGSLPVLGPILGGAASPPVTERETLSEVFPMATASYRMVAFDWITLGAEASYVSYDDNDALEMQLDLQFRGEVIGFSAGWHEKRYDIKGSSFGLDARFKGLFAQLSIYL